MSSRIEAAIDIGTITMLMLVAETEELSSPVGPKKRKINRVLQNCIEYPKLGEGVHARRAFSDEAMARAREVFKKYAEICRGHGVTKIMALATSASRDSRNSREFYAAIKDETGIDVQIIDGDTEARLSFVGGLLDWQDPAKHALMDIGGGSTEFVTLDTSSNTFAITGQSIDMGSIRATELFLSGDPYPKAKLEGLEKGLKDAWKQLRPEVASAIRAREWVAVAGTPTVLAAMSLGIQSFTSERIDGHRISRCDVWDLYESLAVKSLAERQAIALIGKQRADTIVAGSAILATAMDVFEKEDVTISTRGLRHGVLVT